MTEAVRAQSLVANDPNIARALVRNGELVHLDDRQVLVHQQDPNNEIFLILHGAIAIEVNGRRLAVRGAGAHVGELALVDPLAVRSATLVALGPTVLFRGLPQNLWVERRAGSPRQTHSVPVCSPPSRRVAPLRPRCAGLTAWTPAARTSVPALV